MNTKTIVLMLFTLTFCAWAQVQDISIQHYSSFADFNRQLQVSGEADLDHYVIEKLTGDGSTEIQFIDRTGKTIKTLRLNCLDSWLHGASIDYNNSRVFELKVECEYGASRDVIKRIKSKKYTVYDSKGRILITFDKPGYSLLPFSKDFFLGSTVDDHISAGYTAVINSSGDIVHKIQGLGYPEYKDENGSIYIVSDNQNELWALDSAGKQLFNTPISFNEIVTISDNNLICLTYRNEVFVLDGSGKELLRFMPFEVRSNGEAVISKNGKNIFFVFSRLRNPIAGIYKDALLGVYNVEKRAIIWTKQFSANENTDWGVKNLEVSLNEEYYYASFSNGVAKVFSLSGDEIYSQQYDLDRDCGEEIRVFQSQKYLLLTTYSDPVTVINWGEK